MSLTTDLIFIILQSFFIAICDCTSLPQCDENALNSCGGYESLVCNEKNYCECSSGYKHDPDSVSLATACVPYSKDVQPPYSGGNPVTVVFVVLLTLLLLSTALVFIVRRYHLLTWIRQKIFTRRSSGVTYEDVMIGQDDPPITA